MRKTGRRTTIDIDPGPEPNPPILSSKRLAILQIQQLKKDLANLERTVRRIQEMPQDKVKGAGA